MLVFPLGGIGRVVNGAFMVLKGHRSIVNQVRFNPHTYMICSSGVEKIIKVRLSENVFFQYFRKKCFVLLNVVLFRAHPVFSSFSFEKWYVSFAG